MARDTCDERVKRKIAASRPVCVWNRGCFSMGGDFAPKRHLSLSGEIFGPDNWEVKHIIHREAPPVEKSSIPNVSSAQWRNLGCRDRHLSSDGPWECLQESRNVGVRVRHQRRRCLKVASGHAGVHMEMFLTFLLVRWNTSFAWKEGTARIIQ